MIGVINDIDNIIRYEGFRKISNNYVVPIPLTLDGQTADLVMYPNKEIHFFDQSASVHGTYTGYCHLILEYTKTTDTPVVDTNTYSTEEKLTGETWVDGKPIYRKVFNATCSVTGQPAITIDTSELNIDEVITLNGILTETVSSDNKNKIVLPYTGLSMNGITELRYSVSNSSITIANTLSGFDNMPITIIIEYTKTTD